MEKIEHAIGERIDTGIRFVDENIILVVKDATQQQGSCKGCYFEDCELTEETKEMAENIAGVCHMQDRSDHKNVIFKYVKLEEKEQ